MYLPVFFSCPQKATSDRKWILMTGRDSVGNAQVAFLDISDLSNYSSPGVSDALLSHTGANDVKVTMPRENKQRNDVCLSLLQTHAKIVGVPPGWEEVVDFPGDKAEDLADFLAGKPQID